MKGKEKSKKTQDYRSLFIKEANVTARLGKTVYIRKEHHERILKIVQVTLSHRATAGRVSPTPRTW
jgi:hypothetical protein